MAHKNFKYIGGTSALKLFEDNCETKHNKTTGSLEHTKLEAGTVIYTFNKSARSSRATKPNYFKTQDFSQNYHTNQRKPEHCVLNTKESIAFTLGCIAFTIVMYVFGIA